MRLKNSAGDFPTIVVLEGADGSGKSFQAGEVAQQLRDSGMRVVEPTKDPRRRLRKIYKELISGSSDFPSPETSLLLGLSDYADALHRFRTAPADVMLCERYCYSAIADAIALGLDREKASQLTNLFPTPAITLFIDIEAGIAFQRKGECSLAEAGGPEFSREYPTLRESFIAYQEAVRGAYHYLGTAGKIPNLAIIDGTLPREDVTKSIMRELSIRAASARKAP
ncbi:dTMP kinase [Streptomyces sp. NPDC059853]|uniref:dTMP kinase n=1 Tax=Streptomyces sp. NPDC059853 TaxID=3346973 RepID=UPI00366393C2